jgi:hypothetical protein
MGWAVGGIALIVVLVAVGALLAFSRRRPATAVGDPTTPDL